MSKTEKDKKPFVRAIAQGLCAFALVAMLSGSAVAAAVPLVVDFTDYRSGPIDQWLKSKGFELWLDVNRSDAIGLTADARGLSVRALRPAHGLLVNRPLDHNTYSAVEIEWGVQQHPNGASYENNVYNEAIMVHVVFGLEKKPSGSLLAPDLPPFIGLFLCNGDRVGHPYVGRYYRIAGRYVCLNNKPPQEQVASHYDLNQGFREAFGTGPAPAVIAFTVEVDTSSSNGGGLSSAYIKRIRFLP